MIEVRRSGASLAALAAGVLLAVSTAGADAAVRVGHNYRLATDPSPVRGKDAVGLAVDPDNPRHVVELNADWLRGECEYHVSFDGGRTWKGGELRAARGFSDRPCAVGPHLAAPVDGGIAFGSDGAVYAAFATPKPLANGEQEGKSVLVARSTNGGRTFRTGVVVLPGGPSADDGPDYVLPKLAVDPRRRGDRVYVVAGSTESSHDGGQDENTILAISRNGGRNWSGPIQVNAPGVHAIEQSQPAVGRHGHVFVAWRTQEPEPGAEPGDFLPEGRVQVARSTNHGRTWRIADAAQVKGYVYTGPAVPPFTFGRVFTASTFPRLAADRRSGNVYLVYGQGDGGPGAAAASARAHAADHFIAPDLHEYFQRSTNGGRSWSKPLRLNHHLAVPAENVDQTRHANVSVAPDGRVDVVWQDRRHWYRGCTHTHAACQEARLGDTYYRFSRDGGRHFSRDRRITDRSMNNDVGFDYRFGTYWDYGPVSVPVGKNRLLVAWMDSRRGNFQNDTQDIYMARVNLHAHGPLPVKRVSGDDPSDLAVRLSKLAYPGGPEAVLAGTFVTRPWTRVVIVNEHDVAGALAGGVLGRGNIAPVLASGSSGLSREVAREVRRMSPIGAYVVGDRKALSDGVVSDLAKAGVPADQIVRLDGGGDAGTAALIASAIDRRTDAEKAEGHPAFDAAIIANPSSRDAVAASVLAANRRLPVLYVRRSSLPAATADALRSLGIDRTLVIGGRRSVSAAVMRGLPTPKRLGGGRLSATLRELTRESVRRGVPEGNVFVAGSRMDAALLGAAAGRIGGLLLLGDDRKAAARREVGRLGLSRQVDRIVLVG